MDKQDALSKAIEIAKEFARSGQSPAYIPNLIQESYNKIVEIATKDHLLSE